MVSSLQTCLHHNTKHPKQTNHTQKQTTSIETLDPALIRPGRIDRKIEFPLPDVKTKRMIFRIHTGRMGMAPDVDLEGATAHARARAARARPLTAHPCASAAPPQNSSWPRTS